MEESKIKVVAGKPYPASHFATLTVWLCREPPSHLLFFRLFGSTARQMGFLSNAGEGGVNSFFPDIIFQLSLEAAGGARAGGEVDVGVEPLFF